MPMASSEGSLRSEAPAESRTLNESFTRIRGTALYVAKYGANDAPPVRVRTCFPDVQTPNPAVDPSFR
jgi:hypothetical protein